MIREVLRMGNPQLLVRSEPVQELRHAGTRRVAAGSSGHHGRQEGRRPRRAADRRPAPGRDFRCRAQRTLPRRRACPVHRARQSRADAALRGDRRRLGRVPVGPRAARHGAPVRASALRGIRSCSAVRSAARSPDSTPAWSSTNATICWASSIRCGCAIFPGSDTPTSSFPTARPTRSRGQIRNIQRMVRRSRIAP